jgi:acyl transferase domain-containing protein
VSSFGISGTNAHVILEQGAERGPSGRHPREGTLAFLFTGQGAQRPAWAASCTRAFPVFAEALDAVCAELDPTSTAAARRLFDDAEQSCSTRPVHPARAVRARGRAVPAARVVGRAAGLPDRPLDRRARRRARRRGALLADACTLVAARGRLMQALPAGGAMVAIQATEAEVRRC